MVKSLYIHIPFCRKKCFYCDFVSIAHDHDLAASYISVLKKQIRALSGSFNTIFIGGGTPSVLSNHLLDKLLKALVKVKAKDCEFTVEVNPESFTFDKAQLLFNAGVNRISIGVQSFNSKKLENLGRIHTAYQAKNAVDIAACVGFTNISIDLIFGVYNESIKYWQKELEEAVKLNIKHLSCYGLTYEKSTLLGKMLKNKKIKPLEEVILAKMYRLTIDFLFRNRFRQYEVSNFAKTGFTCQHNLNYWDNCSYVGLGPSAVSYIDGARQRNIGSVKEYIKRFNTGKSLCVFKEKLALIRQAKETASLKIRTARGIRFDDFKNRYNLDFLVLEKDAIYEAKKADLVEYIVKHDKVIGMRLTKKGFLFCDTVSSLFV